VKESELTHISEKIRELDEQLGSFRNQRNELNKEAKKLAETRDEFNDKFRKLKDEVQSLKSKRDELNAQVRELKAKRDEARELVSKNRASAKALTEKLNAISSQVPGSYESTVREMEKLEWRIQTTPLSLREENRIIAQVKELEGQLNKLKKKKEIEKKIAKLREDSRLIELQANAIHKRLTALAEQSEEYHKRMMDVVNSATDLKRKADEAHQAYVNTKSKGDNAHFEYMAKIMMIRDLEGQIKNFYEAEQANKEAEVQKKVEELAENKLKKGKKLTFEEFKLLVDKGAI
jgi:phosphoserine phosphatase